ncbi:MAG TPA: FliA/WhiG family RNA polymerase sigma factor [Gemmatimonadaceae bacterium]|nr:FliA/WhiG family RNA polymerase sigma factor [Gemmatimonadaceae bacterium]
MPAQMLQSSDAYFGSAPTPALMREHLGLVHHVARQLARQMHDEVELDELVSAGTIGLAQAVESFESSRGLSFSTFAVPRIRGAMLDELRRQDHVPRSVRRKGRALADARATLSTALGRPPRQAEMADALGIPQPMLRQWELDVQSGNLLSLDDGERKADDEHRSPRRMARTIADECVDDVDERIEREQRQALLQIALQGLSRQERVVLALHYQEELKLQEVAQVLGLSPSRISQVRTGALEKLRSALGRRLA